MPASTSAGGPSAGARSPPRSRRPPASPPRPAAARRPRPGPARRGGWPATRAAPGGRPAGPRRPPTRRSRRRAGRATRRTPPRCSRPSRRPDPGSTSRRRGPAPPRPPGVRPPGRCRSAAGACPASRPRRDPPVRPPRQPPCAPLHRPPARVTAAALTVRAADRSAPARRRSASRARPPSAPGVPSPWQRRTLVPRAARRPGAPAPAAAGSARSTGPHAAARSGASARPPPVPRRAAAAGHAPPRRHRRAPTASGEYAPPGLVPAAGDPGDRQGRDHQGLRIQEFVAADDRFEVDRSQDRMLFTFNPSGFLRRR